MDVMRTDTGKPSKRHQAKKSIKQFNLTPFSV
jgi:hypothetical protein